MTAMAMALARVTMTAVTASTATSVAAVSEQSCLRLFGRLGEREPEDGNKCGRASNDPPLHLGFSTVQGKK
jgi:hypothetical protein